MKKTITAFIAIMALAHAVSAQKMSIENVYKITLRNSAAIRQGSEVKGYYFFYVSDKVDRNTNEYTLRITDENLTVLKDVKFTDSKHVKVLESSFNGTDLIFLFYNDDDRKLEYKVYGADGKEKFSYVRELTKKDRAYLENTYLAMDDEENTYKGLYPVEGLGFISNTPSREDRDYTFEIDFFSTGQKKQWTYTPTEGAKRFMGDYLGTSNGVVYLEVLKYSSMLDQKPDSRLVGLSLETGKQLFDVSTDSKYRFFPVNLSLLNDGSAFILGEFYDPGANIAKANSRGFAFWKVDESGKITFEKYCSWDLDMAKYLTVSSGGKIEDFGYMYLHKMVQVADGSIYAVGEGFKKAASALGIASQIMSGGRGGMSAVKIKVTNMILIKFDKDFNVADAKIYEKNPNNVELPTGGAYVSTAALGKLIKYSFGGFDYAYTQENNDKTSFTVCYSDYVRGKDYRGSTFNSITYNDGKITTDKINTKSDASRSAILPGKQGQVLLLDYYRKDKRLDIHFEKLN
jgi:hypothetical protein